MFRKIIVALLAIVCIGLFVQTDATARAGWRHGNGWARGAPVLSVIGGAILGFEGGLYEYPYSGYGEYAEYGPWAYSRSRGSQCYPAREPVWTGDGWLSRRIQICE